MTTPSSSTTTTSNGLRECAARDSDNDGKSDCDDIVFDIASAKSRFTALDSWVYGGNGAAVARVEADFARLPASVSTLSFSELDTTSELQSTALRSKPIEIRPDAGARFDGAGHVYLVGGDASVCLSASRTIDLNDLCLGTFSRNAWSCLPGRVSVEEGMLCGKTPHFSAFALLAPSLLPATTTTMSTVSTTGSEMSTTTPTTSSGETAPETIAATGTSGAPIVPGPTTSQTTLIIIIVCVVGGLLLCGLLIGLLVWRAQRKNKRRDDAEDTRMSPVGGASSIQSPSNVPLIDSAALDTVDRQCAKCHTWLTGMVVEAEGGFWHLRCFSCDLCSLPLKLGAFEHVGEHVYCASCAAEHSARPATSTRTSQKNRSLAGSEIYVDEDPVVIVDGTSEESDAPVGESPRGSRALSTDSRGSKTKGRRPSGGAKARDAEATARAKARAAAAREASRLRHEEERKRRDVAKAKQQRARRAPQHDSDSERSDSRNVDSKRNSDVRFSGVFAALDGDGVSDDDSDKITLGPKASTPAIKKN